MKLRDLRAGHIVERVQAGDSSPPLASSGGTAVPLRRPRRVYFMNTETYDQIRGRGPSRRRPDYLKEGAFMQVTDLRRRSARHRVARGGGSSSRAVGPRRERRHGDRRHQARHA